MDSDHEEFNLALTHFNGKDKPVLRRGNFSTLKTAIIIQLADLDLFTKGIYLEY